MFYLVKYHSRIILTFKKGVGGLTFLEGQRSWLTGSLSQVLLAREP